MSPLAVRMTTHFVVENFFERAEECRAAFEAHFSRANTRGEHSERKVWDYAFVPNLHAHFKARPTSILPAHFVEAFMSRLRRLSVERLGLGDVGCPTLSLYVNGCGDALGGNPKRGQVAERGDGAEDRRFAYVYSLTRWDDRTFEGGETRVLPESGDWALIPARFNQLLLVDDRAPHGVQVLKGPMDPLQGRLVMHGHIQEDHKHVFGALSPAQVDAAWSAALPELESKLGDFDGEYDGLISLKLTVTAGSVDDCTVLVDRLLPTAEATDPPALIRDAIVAWATALRFPPLDAPTTVIAPFCLSSA